MCGRHGNTPFPRDPQTGTTERRTLEGRADASLVLVSMSVDVAVDDVIVVGRRRFGDIQVGEVLRLAVETILHLARTELLEGPVAE